MSKLIDSFGVGIARTPIIGALFIGMLRAVRRYSVRVMRRVDKEYVRPREWSNSELEKIAPFYYGTIVNVSGWRDEDQRGRLYRSYFPNAKEYSITNFVGARTDASPSTIQLDLTQDIPNGLRESFDVVFNHTTLEHVFDFKKAFSTLCALSKDTVILVTPFMQQVHYSEGSYGDYWRFTPMCLRRLFEDNGLSVIYQATNDNEWYISYVFTVATKQPDRWKSTFTTTHFNDSVGDSLLCIER